MILADNSVYSTTPSLENQIQPLATSELSTYGFENSEIADELSTISALVIDENNSALSNTNLKLLVNGEEQETLTSDENGNVTMQVPADQEYTLIATRDGFEDRSIVLPAETLGQQEDLLVVMNSTFIDSGLPDDQLPTTELDPLAVSDDGWDQSALDNNYRSNIEGVALTELRDESGESDGSDELSTTELDPLAISDNTLEDSGLGGDSRPNIEGVALT
jgi:hypothetical protein